MFSSWKNLNIGCVNVGYKDGRVHWIFQLEQENHERHCNAYQCGIVRVISIPFTVIKRLMYACNKHIVVLSLLLVVNNELYHRLHLI